MESIAPPYHPAILGIPFVGSAAQAPSALVVNGLRNMGNDLRCQMRVCVIPPINVVDRLFVTWTRNRH
jgi:hypothetical protein